MVVWDTWVGMLVCTGTCTATCTLSAGPVDCGAMCMPGSVEKVQRLVDDAVAKGAKALTGGRPGPADGNSAGGKEGQFYPPTVLVGVTKDMLIWREEVFGPVSGVGSLQWAVACNGCSLQ